MNGGLRLAEAKSLVQSHGDRRPNQDHSQKNLILGAKSEFQSALPLFLVWLQASGKNSLKLKEQKAPL
jgi:hypothetical protein